MNRELMELDPGLLYELTDPCPVCGAGFGQQCSIPDPMADGLGIELAQKVHAQRLVTKPLFGDQMSSCSAMFRAFIHWYPGQKPPSREVEILDLDTFSLESESRDIEAKRLTAKEAVLEDLRADLDDYGFLTHHKIVDPAVEEGFIEVWGEVTCKWTKVNSIECGEDWDSEVEVTIRGTHLVQEETLRCMGFLDEVPGGNSVKFQGEL